MPLSAPSYLAWVRTLPSALSGKSPCVAHHLIGHGRLSQRKCSDYLSMPLTDQEHRDLHDMGWRQWEQTYGKTQHQLVVETLMEALRLGILSFDERRAVACG
jgi:alpha-galactosidase